MLGYEFLADRSVIMQEGASVSKGKEGKEKRTGREGEEGKGDEAVGSRKDERVGQKGEAQGRKPKGRVRGGVARGWGRGMPVWEGAGWGGGNKT